MLLEPLNSARFIYNVIVVMQLKIELGMTKKRHTAAVAIATAKDECSEKWQQSEKKQWIETDMKGRKWNEMNKKGANQTPTKHTDEQSIFVNFVCSVSRFLRLILRIRLKPLIMNNKAIKKKIWKMPAIKAKMKLKKNKIYPQ